jgi:hypothetical protein
MRVGGADKAAIALVQVGPPTLTLVANSSRNPQDDFWTTEMSHSTQFSGNALSPSR